MFDILFSDLYNLSHRIFIRSYFMRLSSSNIKFVVVTCGKPYPENMSPVFLC